MARRHSKGKWAGLTAVTIARLMGCHISTCKRYLYSLKEKREELTEEDIGRLIYDYRFAKDLGLINKTLKSVDFENQWRRSNNSPGS